MKLASICMMPEQLCKSGQKLYMIAQSKRKNKNMSYNNDLYFCATKLSQTKVLITAAEEEKLEEYLKKSWTKKYSNKDINYFCPDLKQKTIDALWAKIKELEAIRDYSLKASSKLEAYMKKNNLKNILVDSKKHGIVSIDRSDYNQYPTNLSYIQSPGKKKTINGKEYYVLSNKDIDKVCSGKIFDDFLLINSKYMKHFEKYSGLEENVCVFLDIDNKKRSIGKDNDPIVLGGIGDGLILIHSSYGRMKVERVENVKAII